jgi:transposase
MLNKERILKLNTKELRRTILQLIDRQNQTETQLNQTKTRLSRTEAQFRKEKEALKKAEARYREVLEKLEDLRYKFQLLLCQLYAPKSEKGEAAEGKEFDEAVLTPEEMETVKKAEEEIQVAAHKRKKVVNKGGGRHPLPADLTRIEITHTLPDKEQRCPRCGKRLREIGEEISELLKLIPQKVVVEKHIRKKYGCSCDECVKLAPLPKFPIPKSIATPSLLAHIIVSKYKDALPLYRQEKIWQRYGVDLPRKSLCYWILKSAELAEPLISLMKARMLSGIKINADETPVQVMKEAGRKNTTKSYMFAFLGNKAVVYIYNPTRCSEIPTNFLTSYTGYLQTDDYAGYNEACKENSITRLYCWAHAKRKFHDIVKTAETKGKAYVALQYIKKLYRVEREAREAKMDVEQKKSIRQKEAKPILEEFKIWLDQTQKTTPPKSPLGKAIHYTLDNWEGLIVYLENGHLDIDNNVAERKIKPFVVGRKNWLFMGSPSGAKAGAIWYSLIETAVDNGIEPFAYLQYILEKLPYCKTDEERIKLLPWNCHLAEITEMLEPKKLEQFCCN